MEPAVALSGSDELTPEEQTQQDELSKEIEQALDWRAARAAYEDTP